MHAPSARVATPGTVERTPRALGLGAAFVPLQAVAVADAIFEEIRSLGHGTRAPELTDRHLEVLASVFEEKHLSNALELVQSGKVKRLVAKTSRRSCFGVRGRTREGGVPVLPRRVVLVPRVPVGRHPAPGEPVACKHQLAVKVATATNAYESESRTCSWRSCWRACARGGGREEAFASRKRRLRAVTAKRACTSHALERCLYCGGEDHLCERRRAVRASQKTKTRCLIRRRGWQIPTIPTIALVCVCSIHARTST